MKYETSEARLLNTFEGGLQQQNQAASFEVYEGRGLDSRVRQGVSARFVAVAKAAVLIGLFIAVVGLIRVGFISSTVSNLKAANATRYQISVNESLVDELQVEQSVLSNSRRIVKIATENYGMTLPVDTETIEMGTQVAQGTQTASDATAQLTSTVRH